MGVFRVLLGISGLFRIYKLHIPNALLQSWFESMPGSQFFVFNYLQEDVGPSCTDVVRMVKSEQINSTHFANLFFCFSLIPFFELAFTDKHGFPMRIHSCDRWCGCFSTFLASCSGIHKRMLLKLRISVLFRP